MKTGSRRPKGKKIVALAISPVPPSTPDHSLDRMHEIRQRYLELWSDPMNTQEEREIARELEVPISQLVTWRLDPSFHEVAYKRYRSALQSSIIPVLRKLVLRAHKGDREAVRQFLEITGVVASKGPTINQFNLGGQSDSFQSQMVRDLSDDDLDREIGVAFAHLYSSDIQVTGGKVLPIEDAEVVSIK